MSRTPGGNVCPPKAYRWGGKQQRLVIYVCSEPIDDIQPPGAYRGRLSELGLPLYRPQT